MNSKNQEPSPICYIMNVEAAIFKEEKWLLIKRSEKEKYGGGFISFVGGKVDKMEEESDILEKTLIREIYEEVGIEVEEEMTYVNSSLFFAVEEPVVDIVFLCKYKSGRAYCKSPDEVAKVYWMTIEEVINHSSIPIWLKRNIMLADSIRQSLS